MTVCITRPTMEGHNFTKVDFSSIEPFEPVASSERGERGAHLAGPFHRQMGASRLIHGDALDMLPKIENESVGLVVTSPPYNIGKSYEKRTSLAEYVEFQERIIEECHRTLRLRGAMCWQVGNYVEDGEVLPIDSLIIPIFRKLGMKVRNRIVWTFGHGLHCKNRLSGRHETIVWATKSDNYVFDMDSIRVPQKYPGKKHYKGPHKGELSGNPLGKNPGDVWDDISNVKHNHPEKLDHPCQFPEALIDRLVSALTEQGERVLDPFAGTGTVGVVCNRLGRSSVLIEREERYIEMAGRRLEKALVEAGSDKAVLHSSKGTEWIPT